MRRILALAREDVRLTLRDRSSTFWIFIAPFLWVFFFGTFNRPSDPSQTKVGLLVLQQETTPLAERMVAGLRAENFDVTVVLPGQEPPEAKSAPPRSLTIPAGFAEAIASKQKVTLDLRSSKDANPEATFATQVALHKAIVRLLGGEALGGFEARDDAVRVVSSWGGGRVVPSGHYQTIPGNLVMFVLIACVTYGSALLAQERRNGLLRRLAASPLRRSELILGKVLGRVSIGALQVAVFIAMSLAIFRIGWGRSPAGLALLLGAFLLCAASIGMLGGSIFRSPDAAAGIGVVMVLLMSALGGCWWPSEVMPGWMRSASYVFPTAWAMNGLHELLSWNGTLRDVLPHCAVLCLFALAAGGGAVAKLRTSA